ncbi:MAG: RHS repeat-associated core domain-containing protein, partial [candidate division WOR-3 bacterium]
SYPPLSSHSLSAHREHDPESGLVHMRARMYEPRMGRFTQIDPVLNNRMNDQYIYASNNPATHYDPLGLQDEKPELIVASLIGMLSEEEQTAYYQNYTQMWNKPFSRASAKSGYKLTAANPRYIKPGTDAVGLTRGINKGDISVLIAHGGNDKIALPGGAVVGSEDIANIAPPKEGMRTKLLVICVCKSEEGGEKIATAYANLGIPVVIAAAKMGISDEKMSTLTMRFLTGTTNPDASKRESISQAFEAAAKEAGLWDSNKNQPSGVVMRTAKGTDTSKPLEFGK